MIVVKDNTGTQNIHDSFLLKYSIIQYGHNWTVYINYLKCCILFCILYLQNTRFIVCMSEREREILCNCNNRRRENYF
jgi:hypothetical protein